MNASNCTDPRWNAAKHLREQESILFRKAKVAQEWWDFCDHFNPDGLHDAQKTLAVALNELHVFQHDLLLELNEIYT